MIVQYIMEDNTEDFQEMLNIMKIEDFKQVKEQKKVASIFIQMKRGSNQKAELFYKNNIYAKVLNALMMACLQSSQYNHRLNIFYGQLQNIYFKMQLQTHFLAMKQFKNIRQEESNKKINIVMNQRKKGSMKCFSNIMRRIFFNRLQKSRAQAQKTPIKEAYKINILPKQQRTSSISKNYLKKDTKEQNFYKKQLAQSRNSAKSTYSMSFQLGGRRKYAAVKQLPRLPQLEEIKEKNPQKADQVHNQRNKQVINQVKTLQQQKIISSRISKLNEQGERKLLDQKPEKQKHKEISLNKKFNKDSILATICEIKILQIAQFTEIINEYSNSLKYESLINEKAFLSHSIATLEKIISL